ncbi:MAG: T9SS type A sorting domain-containing protein [Bacteroidia bacterium]
MKLILIALFLCISNVVLSQDCSNDTIKPLIHLNTPDTVLHPVGTYYHSVSVNVSDNCSRSFEITFGKLSNVNTYALGIFTEEFRATDKSGNTSAKTRFVKVADLEAPIITGETVRRRVNTPIDLSVFLNLKDNYDSPSILHSNLIELYNDVDFSEPGEYKVIYRTKDNSENLSDSFELEVIISNEVLGVSTLSKHVFSIFPNPTNGSVNVQIPKRVEGAFIRVYNSSGSKIFEQSTRNLSNIEIVLPEISGLYYLQIQAPQRYNYLYKVIRL